MAIKNEINILIFLIKRHTQNIFNEFIQSIRSGTKYIEEH